MESDVASLLDGSDSFLETTVHVYSSKCNRLLGTGRHKTGCDL